MAVSPKLGLPLLDPGGVGGEDQVNEILNYIDPGIVFAAEAKQNVPPGAPTVGQVYLVGPAPTGAWALQTEDTMAFYYGGWQFRTPYEGCLCYRKDVGEWFSFSTECSTPTFAALKPVWSTTQYPLVGRANGEGRYSKLVDVGALPNNTTKSVAHGISSLKLTEPVQFIGSLVDGSSNRYPIPVSIPGTGSIGCSLDATNLNVFTSFDASSWTGKILLVYALNPS